MKRIDKLMDYGLNAIVNDRYLLIRVKAPGMDGLEMIINPPVNIMSKLEYYRNAYTEDLKLKANPEVEIIDFMEYDFEKNEIYFYQGDLNEEYMYEDAEVEVLEDDK